MLKKQIKENYRNIISFGITLTFAFVLFMVYAVGKRVGFCDEVFTYTITNSNRLIQQFFYNTWMSGDQILESLTHGESDSFLQMLRMVKGDMVHPPLYYALFYISSLIFGENFTPWTGLLVNLPAFVGTAVLFWLILKRIFNSPAVSAMGVMVLMLSQAMISDGMLIRMYMVYTFFTALFVYANLLLMTKKSLGNYILLGLSTTCGFLTQYYFAFFAIGFFIIDSIFNISKKKVLDIAKYLFTMIAAVVCATVLWTFWPWAVLNSPHSGAFLTGSNSFITIASKILDSYKIMTVSIFQKAYPVMLYIIPVFILAYIIFGKVRNPFAETKGFVVRLFSTAVWYSGIVRILTPDSLTSTRYYYSSDFLFMAAIIICLFSVIEMIIFELSEKRRMIIQLICGIAAVLTMYTLTLTGYGIDYYPDAALFDRQSEELEKYSDIPWIIAGEDNWTIETNLPDYTIPDRIILTNSSFDIEEGIFEGIDEFVFLEYNPERNERLTKKNLYSFYIDTNKDVEMTEITSRNYITYYYCTTKSIEAVNKAVKDFISASVECPLIVVNDTGWFEPEKLYGDAPVPELIYITAETPRDRTDIYDDVDRFIIATSLLDAESIPQDIAAYYAIGSTGAFFTVDYVGRMSKMGIYVCNRYIEE